MRNSSFAAVRPRRWDLAELLRQPSPSRGGSAAVPGLFHPRLRRMALVWVAVSLPVIMVVGSLVDTTSGYLVVFAVLASGLYTSPALANTWLAARRAPAPDNRCWWLWLAALALMYSTGCAMLVGTVTDYRTSITFNTTFVVVISLLVMTAVVLMVRTRSGLRALSVDLIESIMSVIVVVAPAALVWGDDVVGAEAAWYAVPSAVAAAAMVFGVYWAVLLFVRLRADGSTATAIGRVAVALAVVGLTNAVGQTMQGVSGFALPSGLLLGLQGLCMSFLLFIPLYVPDSISPGLDRLAPKDQVRGAWLPATLMLVGLPVLLAATLVLQGKHAWAPLFSFGVAAILLVLGALRQLAAVHETRRLYRQVEQAAAMRRELLAQVMQRGDDDRHRVAAQLHEQAVSAYATFVSFIQTSALAPAGAGGGPLAGASAIVRDEMRDQAESLRQLMLAVQPLEVDRPRSQSLSAPIHAYVDGLYGDRRVPEQVVTVADDVVLDWSTETVVLRIVQEAVRNVWQHSAASRIEVSVQANGGGVVEVGIVDDGVGFDPSAAMFESGIAAMRSFAVLGQGSLDIDSAPGEGTRVTARLGCVDAPGGESGAAVPVPRLRLLRGDRGSVDEA